MPKKPITRRQQEWLDHIRAAQSQGMSLPEYARSQGLSPRKIAQWRRRLTELGFLSIANPEQANALVAVRTPLASESGVLADASEAVTRDPEKPETAECRIMCPNGVRLELTGLTTEMVESVVIRMVRIAGMP